MKFHYSEPYESILHPASLNFRETFLEAIFRKPFRLFCHILNCVSCNRKVPSLPWWFQSSKQVKIRWCQVRRVWGILQCHHNAKKFLTKTDWCAGALSWRTNQLFFSSSPFFKVFPSDWFPKVMIYLFIHSFTISFILYIIASNSSKY